MSGTVRDSRMPPPPTAGRISAVSRPHATGRDMNRSGALPSPALSGSGSKGWIRRPSQLCPPSAPAGKRPV